MSDDLYDGPCEAGCISFHGGERKHHKDCGHYPHSLTKVNADRIEELEAKLAKAVEAMEDDMIYGVITHTSRATLAELKGEDRG
jgi:hypothetical protein